MFDRYTCAKCNIDMAYVIAIDNCASYFCLCKTCFNQLAEDSKKQYGRKR